MLIMYRRIKLSLTLGRIFIFLIVCLVAWSLFIVIREREKNVDAPQQSFIQVVEVVLWDERIQPFLMDVEWSATWVWHKSTSWVMHVVQWGKQRWDDLKLLFVGSSMVLAQNSSKMFFNSAIFIIITIVNIDII